MFLTSLVARYVTLEHPIKGVRRAALNASPIDRSVTANLNSPLDIRGGEAGKIRNRSGSVRMLRRYSYTC